MYGFPHHRPESSPLARAGAARFAALCVFAATVLLGGCAARKQAASAPAATPEVLVAEVKREQVPIVREWVSTLNGSSNAQIQARVQGYLQKQDYVNGSAVNKGDLLFEIDPRPFQAAVDQAKAVLAKEMANQLETQLTENRDLQLFASKTIAAEERDQAVQANAASKARVQAAAAALREADLNLTYTKIMAPISGIAGIAVPGIGDLVGPSTGNLTSISTADPIKADFQISEQEYLKSAQKINALATAPFPEDDSITLELVLADGSVHPHKGRISAVNRQFDVRTGTIQVEALFPNPGNILRPGFFARVRLTARAKEGSLVVPQRGILEVQGSYQAAVVGADNKVAIRRVKLGERAGRMWVVLQGLSEGERVVAEGLQKARNGAAVLPKPFVSGSETGGTADGAETSASATSSPGHETGQPATAPETR